MANSFSFGMSSSSSSQSQAFPFYQLSSSSTFSFGSSPQLSFSSSSTPVASFSYPSFPLSSSSDTVSAIASFSSMEALSASSPFFFASSSSISSSAPTSIPSFCSALGPGFHSAPAFSLGFGSGSSPSAPPSLFASSTRFGTSSSSPSLFPPFGVSSSSSASTSTPIFGASSSPPLFFSSASALSFPASVSLFGVSSPSSSSCIPLFGASSSSLSPLLSGTLAPTAASTTTDSSSTAASTPPFPSFPSSPVSFGFPKPSSPDARLVTSTMPAPASRPGFGLGIPAPTPLFISPPSIPSLSTTATTTSATPTSSNTSLFSSQPTAFPAASMPWVQLFSSSLLSFSSSTSTAISTMTPAVTSTAEAKMTAASTPSQFQSTSSSLLCGCTFESPASTEGQIFESKAPTPDSSAEDPADDFKGDGREIKSEPSTPTPSLQDERISATPLDTSGHSPASASVSSTNVSTWQSIKSKLPGLLEDLTIEQVQAHLAEAESMGQEDLCYMLIDICALVEDLHSFRLEVPLTAHAELHRVQEAVAQYEAEWVEIGQSIVATELEVSELEIALTQAKGKLLELKQRQSAIVPPDLQTIEKLRREARKEEAVDRISRAKVAALEAEYEKLLLGLD